MDKKTILIVDDNADTRLVLSARLKANDYHTVFAADALQAMSVALKERPDAILLDVGLPAGMA
jgi:CheY-like chemotaxis protein